MIRVEMWEGAPGRPAKKPWFAVHFSDAHKVNPDRVIREISQIEDFYKVGCGSLFHPFGYHYYSDLDILEPSLYMFGEAKIRETIAAWPVVRHGHIIDVADFGGSIATWTHATRELLRSPEEFQGWNELIASLRDYKKEKALD